MNNSVYVSLNTIHETFGLGVFKTAEEAEEAYFEYLLKHENFDSWFRIVKQEFKEEFGKELHTLDDFKRTLTHDVFGDYCDFWQDHDVDWSIQWPKKGQLWEFTQWNSWIDENLYRLLDAILKGEFYKEDLAHYARCHPVLVTHK